MKKWIAVIIIVLLAAFIFLNFLLPAPEKIVVNKNIKASSPDLYRTIANQQTWDKLFPGQFTVTKKLLNTVHINSVTGNKESTGIVFLIPVSNDSTLATWSTDADSHNFFTRIPQYMYHKELANKLSVALDSIKRFTSNTVNTYGMNIIQTSTKDTALVTTKFTTTTYPTNQEIYSYIDKLKSFISSKNAKAAGHPMLNISTVDSTTYRCMVAVPVDRIIETGYNSQITFVRMVPGRFLTAEITGGPHAIKHAHQMMQLYFQDYKRTSMAIPFEYLVTDRINETDTSKWITRIYAPVY